MVPTDYRLDFVTARLIERLDGTRRSYVGESDQAAEAFYRIATEHIDAAMGEFRGLADLTEVEAHADFLRHEVLDTALPRYQRVALAMTADEARHWGLGSLGSPVGRVVLVGLALVGLFILSRFIAYAAVWPLVLADLAFPLVPDLLGVLRKRQYKRELESLVADMGTIQDEATHYARPGRLRVLEPGGASSASSVPPTRDREAT